MTGVTVPLSNPKEAPDVPLMVPVALFADDAVGLVSSLNDALIFCDRITNWCDVNEMGVGIKKCGIMEFLLNPYVDPPVLTEDHPLRSQIKLQTEVVPLVTEYKYLGLTLTPTLDVATIVKRRFRLGTITVSRLEPFLRCTALPLAMRWQVIRAVVLPCLLFGAEVYGMNRALTDRMQSRLNRALRETLRLSGRNPVLFFVVTRRCQKNPEI